MEPSRKSLKHQLEELIASALAQLACAALPAIIVVEPTRDLQHGDFATSVALRLAGAAQRNPVELAQQIVGALPPNEIVAKAEVAGAGFINFFLSPEAISREIASIFELAADYGRNDDVGSFLEPEDSLYRVRYAHAKAMSLSKELRAKGFTFDLALGLAELRSPQSPGGSERQLMRLLPRYPVAVERAASDGSSQSIVYYLRELADSFHTYYNAERAIVDDAGGRNARVALGLSVAQVIRNGLALLGISAPESM